MRLNRDRFSKAFQDAISPQIVNNKPAALARMVITVKGLRRKAQR
jgi:hypothetical protein